jgi:glycosyltransferase involved in cell wall biosynthesis
MSQENLVLGFRNAGLSPSIIISYLPIPSFPRGKSLWVRGENTLLEEGIPVRMVSFINLTPLKQVAIGLAAMWNLLKWAWRVRGCERVVYQFNLTVPPGMFTLLAARLIGASAIVFLNDINVPGETVSDSFLNRFDFWLHRKLIPRFDGHIAVSDAIMRDFAPGRPYLRLEGGVAEGLLSEFASDLSLLGGKDEGFVVLFAGSLDAVNGIDIILEAFSQLHGGNYRLMIAGAGPLEESVKSAAQKDSRINYLGFISLSELLKLYRSADVLLSIRPTKDMHTKYFFPSKVMEYLASGTPVIATCTGHTEEEFGAFCYLLREETPEALAAMICRVASLAIEERRRVGLSARTYMQKNKGWMNQAKKVVEFIHEIASKPETRTFAKAHALEAVDGHNADGRHLGTQRLK